MTKPNQPPYRESVFHLPGTPLSDLLTMGSVTLEGLENLRVRHERVVEDGLVACIETGLDHPILPGDWEDHSVFVRAAPGPEAPVLPGEGPLPEGDEVMTPEEVRARGLPETLDGLFTRVEHRAAVDSLVRVIEESGPKNLPLSPSSSPSLENGQASVPATGAELAYNQAMRVLGEEERRMSVIREVEFDGSDPPGGCSDSRFQEFFVESQWMFDTLTRIFDQLYKCDRGGVKEVIFLAELRKLADEFKRRSSKPTP